MGKTLALVAAIIGAGALAGPAFAYHKRHTPPEYHPDHAACVRGGWNHPACRHLSHYGSSSDYYYHHDPRHRHGMAFGD